LLPEEGFEELPITARHAEAAAALPLLHRDPFDRMLVAQAHLEGLTLVTHDATVAAYDVDRLSL
jgi:PIN domain nuclease of toxin-antitoxin system